MVTNYFLEFFHHIFRSKSNIYNLIGVKIIRPFIRLYITNLFIHIVSNCFLYTKFSLFKYDSTCLEFFTFELSWTVSMATDGIDWAITVNALSAIRSCWLSAVLLAWNLSNHTNSYTSDASKTPSANNESTNLLVDSVSCIVGSIWVTPDLSVEGEQQMAIDIIILGRNEVFRFSQWWWRIQTPLDWGSSEVNTTIYRECVARLFLRACET